MDFSVFDTSKMDEYTAQAKAEWGNTEAYKEYEKKTKQMSDTQKETAWVDMMEQFVAFGKLTKKEPSSKEVQDQVKQLQQYITEHFYTCSNEILAGLGKMYASGGSMTENIDKAGGKGTAEFVSKAIEVYCNEKVTV